MLLGTFVFTLMNVAIKLVPHIPAVEIVFFRSVISLVLSYGFLRKAGIPVFGKNKKLLMLRGIAGAFALIMYFKLLQGVPLASATVILFLSPVFASIMGVFILHEKVRKKQWLFFALSFLGVVVIKDFDARIGMTYLLLGIGASFFQGVAYNIIRKLSKNEHPMVIIFYFPMVTLPVTALWSSFIWVAPSGMDWLILLVIGVLTQIAQYFMTRSLQLEKIAKVSGVRYLSIIYALLFGYFIFDESFTMQVYFGMALTVVGVALNIWYKHSKLSGGKAVLKERLTN